MPWPATKMRYTGVLNSSPLSLPLKAAVALACVAGLVVMAFVFFIWPLQEKSAIVNAGLKYQNGAVVAGVEGSLTDADKVDKTDIAPTTEGIIVRPALIIALK